MIAALFLAIVALALVAHEGFTVSDVVALALLVPIAWLMLGGGERWLARRLARRRGTGG